MIQLGIVGSLLGIVAGFIELSIGDQILPWIGNKENPVLLGFITLFLSTLAFTSVNSARTSDNPSNDHKLAIFLGVLLPTVICFTTVGRLWYLPGLLLLISASLLAFDNWFRSPITFFPKTFSRENLAVRMAGVFGSLVILISIGLAFWNSAFGLFQSDVLGNNEKVLTEVIPMDFVHLTYLSGSLATEKNIEVSQVMIVYISLLIGTMLVLISSLADSRLFTKIGGMIVFLGLILFLFWLPVILKESQISTRTVSLMGSLSWGWYLALFGISLPMIVNVIYSDKNKNKLVRIAKLSK
jgi:hypothetical protein